jgi:hypothetical protein
MAGMSEHHAQSVGKHKQNAWAIGQYIRPLRRVDVMERVEMSITLRSRDAADCALRNSIRHHTLINDNPTSG